MVRDHRTAPAPKKVIRAGRNYDKTPDRKQVIVNGKRVPAKWMAVPWSATTAPRARRSVTTALR